MSFVIVEVIFKFENKIATLPVVTNDLYQVASVFDSSDGVVVFKVIADHPVYPEAFGYAKLEAWKKWVLKFEPEHFK